MFTSMFPKIAPPLRTLGRLVVSGHPVGCNPPLFVQLSSLRSIAFHGQRCRQQLPLPVFLPEETKDDRERIAILKVEVEKARRPPDKSLYDRSARGIERMDSEGNFLCTKCRLFKTADAFSRNPNGKYGYQSRCKLCHADEELSYRTHTLRGVMTTFLSSARGSAAKRSLIPGRSEAGHCEIDLGFLLNLWLKQKGRCAYSDIVMNIEPYTPWKMSLERCDDTLGYVPGNVVFICAEFNTSDHSVNRKCIVIGSSKWSREKVHSVPDACVLSVAMDDIELDKITENMKVTRIGRTNMPRLASSSGEISCSSCMLLKPLDEFYVHQRGSFGRAPICKLCKLAYMHDYHNTTAGFLKSRLRSAKYAAQLRAEKGRDHAGEFDLTIDDIVTLYKKQQGLCYYAGIKMVLKPHSTWMCSIERLDNTKGYVGSNVALICCEFQTSDYSYKAKTPVTGTAQWSKEKLSMLLEWLGSKKSTPRAE